MSLIEAVGLSSGQAVGLGSSFILRPTSARILSSLQQPSDQWEAKFPGAAEYLNVDPERTIDLEIGVLDAVGSPQVLRPIKAGVIDEYRLEIVKDGVVSHLKGRDAGAALLDTEFKTLYKRLQGVDATPTRETLTRGESEKILLEFSGEAVAAAAGVTVKVGVFRARQVAEEIVASVGLVPMWQCRDYELWEDFDATGRRIDLLQRLVDPWCAVEPSRVDVFWDGDTVYLRRRVAFPVAADFILQYQAAAAAPHIRCLNVNVRKKRLPIYGDLTLSGRSEAGQTAHDFDPKESLKDPSQNVSVIPFKAEEDPDSLGVDYTPGTATQRSASSSYDPSGQLVARVETLSTYQIPNQVLLRTQKDTYAMSGGEEKLIKREVKTVDYQPFTYDAKGATNSPMPVREFAGIYRWVDETLPDGPTVTVFKQDTEETTSYSYDEDNYLTTAATIKQVEQDGQLVPTSLLVKHYQDTGPGSYSIQSDRYVHQDEQGVKVPHLVQSDLTPATGHRPGGPNRPATKPLNSALAGVVTVPLAQRPTVSTDPAAKATSAGSPHMSEADLAFIEAQHVEASGLYECELSLTALSMPWIRRGSIIEIAGVTDQDGGALPLGRALVYQLDMTYDEAARSSISQIRAVYYEEAA